MSPWLVFMRFGLLRLCRLARPAELCRRLCVLVCWRSVGVNSWLAGRKPGGSTPHRRQLLLLSCGVWSECVLQPGSRARLLSACPGRSLFHSSIVAPNQAQDDALSAATPSAMRKIAPHTGRSPTLDPQHSQRSVYRPQTFRGLQPPEGDMIPLQLQGDIIAM